jgi:hypothetical protein
VVCSLLGRDKEYAHKMRQEAKNATGWPTAISWGTSRYSGKV